MKCRTRIYYTEEQKAVMWDRKMVDVLALVLLHDEHQVEQAIITALTSGHPSKQHVMLLNPLSVTRWLCHTPVSIKGVKGYL